MVSIVPKHGRLQVKKEPLLYNAIRWPLLLPSGAPAGRGPQPAGTFETCRRQRSLHTLVCVLAREAEALLVPGS